MLMKHRGPDAYGQWGIDNRIQLAHLRLAIIDLSRESDQPMRSASGRLVICFNGEIYNYLELRAELQALGHEFRTDSDTEVLLASYQEWGSRCVSRFNGDWAFAIYDADTETVFCSRDRFGVKPFNYAVIDGQLIFSSEIKSMVAYHAGLRTPDYDVIASYCRNGLGAEHEHSWFAGVKRLPPAHNLTWKDGALSIERYWQYPTEVLDGPSLAEAEHAYRTLFTNAVKLRMRSDVPFGTTLSSGIDSGSIVSVVCEHYTGTHKTFTATFKPDEFDGREKSAYSSDVEIDESKLVKRLAERLGLEPFFLDCSTGDFLEELSRVIYHLESGHSSPAIVPLSRILRAARDHVTVILEGQGADELLGGYILSTFPALIFELVRRGKLREAWREFKQFSSLYSVWYSVKLFVRLLNSRTIERMYHRATGAHRVFGPLLRDDPRARYREDDVPRVRGQLNQVLCRSHARGLVNLLHYGDALSMANSLESRLPFLDVDLVEYCFKLPFHLKARDGVGKYVHRRAMRGIVPEFILDNRLKFGFNTPLAIHFNSADSEANQILLSDTCLNRGIFDPSGMRAIIDDQVQGKRDNATLLYRLLSVEMWFREFIDRSPPSPSPTSAAHRSRVRETASVN